MWGQGQEPLKTVSEIHIQIHGGWYGERMLGICRCFTHTQADFTGCVTHRRTVCGQPLPSWAPRASDQSTPRSDKKRKQTGHQGPGRKLRWLRGSADRNRHRPPCRPFSHTGMLWAAQWLGVWTSASTSSCLHFIFGWNEDPDPGPVWRRLPWLKDIQFGFRAWSIPLGTDTPLNCTFSKP